MGGQVNADSPAHAEEGQACLCTRQRPPEAHGLQTHALTLRRLNTESDRSKPQKPRGRRSIPCPRPALRGVDVFLKTERADD